MAETVSEFLARGGVIRNCRYQEPDEVLRWGKTHRTTSKFRRGGSMPVERGRQMDGFAEDVLQEHYKSLSGKQS